MKLLAALLIALPVFAQLPVPKETDARLKPDGPQQWGLVQAKITNPGLPRVLLIGDSILEGYRVDVTSALRGKANVDYWKNPYHQSKELNDLLAKVLTYGPYDVIHFNMGLHGWTKGRILDGTYIPLTRAYVEILQRTLPRAKLIWASTTPVTVKDKPGELDPAINPIIVEHNRMAAEVMESLHVPVNDFYSLLINKLDLARGDQFHWKPAAYPILARAATASILQALGQTPAAALPDPSLSEELRARAGLPNFLDKLQAGGPVRIAYLGGSITAANGWRPKTIAWFQAQYPRAQIIEINAAISGTGSDYGAISAGQDVLSKDPDLIFLEHRVNGSAGFDTKSVEGLVRQIWKHNMRTDICLIYTISQPMLAGIQAGKQTPFGTAMERIANYYGIPSIDLGVEIARQEKAGQLVFKGELPVEGKIVFSKDGTHPGEEGHNIYRDIIARSMVAMRGQGTAGPHDIPAPIDSGAWENVKLIPITSVERTSDWEPVDIATDPVYQEDFGRTDGMLRGAIKSTHAGSTLTVHWRGTTLGFSDIPQGEGIEVEVITDNGKPVTLKRLQTEKIRRYSRFFYLPELPNQSHTTVLRIKQLPEGVAFYAGQILTAAPE